MGIGGKDYVEDSVKDGVENAIVAYLKANFDLGE
jgi:hypothetical protein